MNNIGISSLNIELDDCIKSFIIKMNSLLTNENTTIKEIESLIMFIRCYSENLSVRHCLRVNINDCVSYNGRDFMMKSNYIVDYLFDFRDNLWNYKMSEIIDRIGEISINEYIYKLNN